MSRLTYYLCEWHGGFNAVNASHNVIKQGGDEVGEWLLDHLRSEGVGCPEWVVEWLRVLDLEGLTGTGNMPIRLTRTDADFGYAITEITDLGALTPAGPDAAALRAIVTECSVTWNWLNSIRFPGQPTSKAKRAVGTALRLLGAPGHG